MYRIQYYYNPKYASNFIIVNTTKNIWSFCKPGNLFIEKFKGWYPIRDEDYRPGEIFAEVSSFEEFVSLYPEYFI